MAVHRNDGAVLDSQLNLGERSVDKLMSEVGEDEASKRLMALARKTHAQRHGRPHLDEDGAQPSFLVMTTMGTQCPMVFGIAFSERNWACIHQTLEKCVLSAL